MSKIETLWKHRFQQYLKDTRRYMKYILNDHLKLVLLFAIGAGAFYYQQWLDTLSPAFPSALFIAVLLGLVITSGQIQTFLKRADLVFLLALETKLSPYFKRSFLFTLTIHLYVLLIVTAIVAPLHVKVTNDSYQTVFLFFILLVGLKVINLAVAWWFSYFGERPSKWIDYVVRFFLNGAFTYFLFVHAHPLFPVVMGIIIVGLAFYYRSLAKGKPLKWEKLIELEEKRMSLFYRLANLFTDVPHVKEQVKRRLYLDWLLVRIPFKQAATYRYLYIRTFLRSGDYLGLLVRLTVIGTILLFATPFEYGNVVVVLVVVYMTGFQLIPLWKHHKQVIWLSLYPLQIHDRKQAFLKVFQSALYMQIIILAAVLAVSNMMVGLAGIVAGIIFVRLFITMYVMKKLVEK
ncbi:ABC transporter permease [Priestia megaterium]|nr:ABC transporter permease [Priestia megaterium]